MILLRTTEFAFWTLVRFLIIIGIGLIYCELRGIPFPDRVPEDLRMLIFRVIPATAVGHAMALGLLWVRRGVDGILTPRQSALAALLCAVFLASAYLFGTEYMRSMVLRRSVHLTVAFLLSLGIGLMWAPRRVTVAADALANDPSPG